MALTDEQKQHFWENGYLVVRDLLTQEEVEALKEQANLIASGEVSHVPAEWIQVEPVVRRGEIQTASKIESVCQLWNLVPHDEVMRAHAANPKIVDIIVDLLGPDIKLYGDQLFTKPPKHGSRKEYHQDSNSWKHLVPYNLVSCWAVMDDATIENGCLWMILGSHKWGLISREREQGIESRALEGEWENEVPVEWKSGDCSFDHSLSHANRSSKQHRGYVTHYMCSKTKYMGDAPKPDYPLICGQEFPNYV